MITPINRPTNDATINVALDTLSMKKQALIFVGSKRSAEKQAEDIAKKIQGTTYKQIDLSQTALKVLPKPTRQCTRLANCLKKRNCFSS